MDNSGTNARLDLLENVIRSVDESLTGHIEEQRMVNGSLSEGIQEAIETISKIGRVIESLTAEDEGEVGESNDLEGAHFPSGDADAAEAAAHIRSLEERITELVEDSNHALDQSEKLREQLKGLQDELTSERTRNRTLIQTIRLLKGNIRVMCRIRPPPSNAPSESLADFGPHEKGDLSHHWARMSYPRERRDYKGDAIIEPRPFEFERIFGPEDSNNDVFEEVRELIESAISGERVAIFAYGQTGAGKTYTLSHIDPVGDISLDGLIPRTLRLMLENQEIVTGYNISISIIEIYLDKIYDLLQPSDDGLKTETRSGTGVYVPLETLDEAQQIVEEATNIRVVSATDKNAESSRSHLILSFRIRRADESGEGVLRIVDLAGSERPAAAGLSAEQFQEGIKINKSLLNFNQVITALGNGSHVPYNTALTRSIKDTLAPDSRVLMFVMISPFKKDLNVSFQTLEKGEEAMNARLAALSRKNGGASSASTAKTAKTARPKSMIRKSTTPRALTPQSTLKRPLTPKSTTPKTTASRAFPGLRRASASMATGSPLPGSRPTAKSSMSTTQTINRTTSRHPADRTAKTTRTSAPPRREDDQ